MADKKTTNYQKITNILSIVDMPLLVIALIMTIGTPIAFAFDKESNAFNLVAFFCFPAMIFTALAVTGFGLTFALFYLLKPMPTGKIANKTLAIIFFVIAAMGAAGASVIFFAGLTKNAAIWGGLTAIPALIIIVTFVFDILVFKWTKNKKNVSQAN